MATRHKSPLVSYEKISPNSYRPRYQKVSRITPHHVAGKATAKTILGLSGFAAGGRASCSYAIGYDGSMGSGVYEKDAPWTSSSSYNDNRAITFEISNIGGAPDWRISDEAVNAWMDLVIDICNFYGFKKVNYHEKPSYIIGSAAVEKWIKTWCRDDEMCVTLHNWFAATACPGPYFTRQLPWLVKELNRRLSDSGYIWEKFVGEGATYTYSTIRQGSRGSDVMLAQTKLNLHGYVPVLVVDGIFGNQTTITTKAFQKDKGLIADGIIGSKTWVELLKEPEPIHIPENEPNLEYKVRITATALNVRKGPGTNHSVVVTLFRDKNIYTIVEETTGPGATKWGRLKSGVGWIALNHTSKL